jgi:hypothetical protein
VRLGDVAADGSRPWAASRFSAAGGCWGGDGGGMLPGSVNNAQRVRLAGGEWYGAGPATIADIERESLAGVARLLRGGVIGSEACAAAGVALACVPV